MVVLVVKLMSLKCIVGVEAIGAGQELWPRTYLTTGGDPVSLYIGRHLYGDPGSVLQMFQHVLTLREGLLQRGPPETTIREVHRGAS